MRRKFWWCVILLIYWAVVVHFLRSASPVYIDGGGPEPSFYWGRRPPMPDLGEYNRWERYFNFLYSLPYYVAAFIITLLGCGVAPLLGRRWAPLKGGFLRRAAATLALLLVAAMLSDAGVLLRIWYGPVFLLHKYYDPFTIWALAKVFVPATVLSGLIAVGEHRLDGSHECRKMT